MKSINEELNSRQKSILSYIKSHQSIIVKKLIQEMEYSPATIRNDLVFLEQLGRIRRTWGEAHIVEQEVTEFEPIEYEFRSKINLDRKRRVAEKALQLIEDGDTIILDSGTTTYEIARLLNGFKELTVITNGVNIGSLLSKNSDITVILVGGVINGDIQSLTGPYAENFFKKIQANKFFMAASGVRGVEGFTTNSPYEVKVKENAIKAAREVIAVFDSTKFSSYAVNLFASFSDIDKIITNPIVLEEDVKIAAEKNNVKLVFSDK